LGYSLIPINVEIRKSAQVTDRSSERATAQRNKAAAHNKHPNKHHGKPLGTPKKRG
jgi:hypothetical protein